MIKKRRCGREREKRMLLGKVAEKAEGRRDLEERERDVFLRVGVLREAMVDVGRGEIEEVFLEGVLRRRCSEGRERESGEFIFW